MDEPQSNARRDTDIPDDVVLSVRNVSKKFCRNLKRSMWYGIRDLSKNLVGIRPHTETADHSETIVPDVAAGDVGRGRRLQTLTGGQSADESVIVDNAGLRPSEFWALRDISFDLRRGECLGLIGRNGCGKTTLLRLIAGIFPPDQGEIAIRGRVGALIALGAGFHPHMTGRENIYLNGAILGLPRQAIKERLGRIIDFAEIGEFIEAPVSTYSSGMRVRLGFAVAVELEPDILLIDEVLAVGDLAFRIKCMSRIGELLSHSAVIFVSHNTELMSRICHRALVFDHGSLLSDCSIEDAIALYVPPDETVTSLHSVDGIREVKVVPDQADVRYGESLTVTVKFHSDMCFEACCLRLCLLDQQRRIVAEWFSSVHAEDMCIAIGENVLSAHISGLPLAEGEYSFNMAVQPLRSPSYLAWGANVCRLHVSGSPRSPYSIYL